MIFIFRNKDTKSALSPYFVRTRQADVQTAVGVRRDTRGGMPFESPSVLRVEGECALSLIFLAMRAGVCYNVMR